MYIREAHPTDARPGVEGRPGNPARGDPDVKQPRTIDERVIAATACMQSLKLSIPIIVDDMEGTAEKAYGGWPDRIAIIDLDGRIAYHNGPGPAGFRPAVAEAMLKALLAAGGKWSPNLAPPEPSRSEPSQPRAATPRAEAEGRRPPQ